MTNTPSTNHVLRRFDTPEADPSRAIGLREDHPAVVSGRTLFPKSLAHPDDDENILVSGHNNPKLGKRVMKGPMKGFPIYHLTLEERSTCPRSCRMWLTCYGNAMPFARRNDAWSGRRLTIALDHELGVLQRRHPKGYLVRLHTLGDFFSTQYVAAWGRWLAEFPALHVFGYTSCNPMAQHPAERAIGQAVAALAAANWERFAIRVSCADPGPARAVVVDAPDDRLLMCPAQTKDSGCCATCGLCWAPAVKDRAIGFLRHGMTRPWSKPRPGPVADDGVKRPRGRPRKLPIVITADGAPMKTLVKGQPPPAARPDPTPDAERIRRLVEATGIDEKRAAKALAVHGLTRGSGI